MSSVTFEYEADVRDPDTGAWLPLPVVNIAPSADRDRSPFTMASLTLGVLTADMVELLDPRLNDPTAGGQVRWRISQYKDGMRVARLPADGRAVMWARALTRSLDGAELVIAGGESMIDDKICTDDTGAGVLRSRTIGALVDWVLSSVFGSGHAAAVDDIAASALQQLCWPDEVLVGEQYTPVFERELSALGCRLYDAWGLRWVVAGRDNPPTFEGAPEVAKVSTFTKRDIPTLDADVDPIVTGYDDRISRDAGWADVVIARGEYTERGTTHTWQHTAAAPSNTRGIIVEVPEREPSDNVAEGMAHRALRLGRDITVTARARLDILPGMRLELHLRDEIITSDIKSIEWNLSQGEMTIQGQSAATGASDPLDTDKTETLTRTVEAVEREVRSTIAALPPLPTPGESVANVIGELRHIH